MPKVQADFTLVLSNHCSSSSKWHAWENSSIWMFRVVGMAIMLSFHKTTKWGYGIEVLDKRGLLDVVCRVEEYQHQLAHQCSSCAKIFLHTQKCEVKNNGDMGMGHLWLKWVGHL